MFRALGVLCLLLTAGSCARRPDPLPGFPRLVLWAWERPERLPFLNPHAAGVAYLARYIAWKDGHVESRPRLQPLEVPYGTAVMAVVRLDSLSPPLPDSRRIAGEILGDAARPSVRALQIDFDARQSERAWYAELLRDLRARLDPAKPLSMTALASWCLGDPWVRTLPVNDAVPMLFRMGRDEPREVRDFSSDVCRSSMGVSTDENIYAAPHGRRVFIFHPHAWTAEAYRGALLMARRWQ